MADNSNQSENRGGWYAQMGRVRVLVEVLEMLRSQGRGEGPLSPLPVGHGAGTPALLWQVAPINPSQTPIPVSCQRGRGLRSLSPPCPGRGGRARALPPSTTSLPQALGGPGVGHLALSKPLPPPTSSNYPPNA